MLLYFIGSIVLLIILFFIFIRIKYRFWAVQPVYHFYDIYYWFFNVGIIRHELPEKNRYTNLKEIETIEPSKVSDVKLRDFIDLIQLNYLRNDGNTFIPEKENIMPYFEGHNSPTFLSLFWQPDVLLDMKTNNTVETKTLIGAITSRPLTVTIYNTKQHLIKFDVFYVDYLCVKKGFRKKNIAPQLIQTHEYNQCHMNQKMCVSLFKREGELTGIVPITSYNTYLFNMKNWIKPPPELHSKTSLLVGDSQNMYYLYNFINENKKWDITIVPELSNLISLSSSKNLYIYMMMTDMEINAIYIFRKTCTNIEKGKALLTLISSMNSTSIPMKMFIQGFKNALWAILLKNPEYHYLAIEDISDNKCIIDNIKIKTHPVCESPTAYFFYNYARSPVSPYKTFIVN
uniref:glycylpeptide N-tetradecanoyltransferase n=1 Tax=viral metagenome TaxID=1070528 RepID=A0A6C0I7U0_9ZZZZ